MRITSDNIPTFSNIAVVGGTPFDSGKGAAYLLQHNIPARAVAISTKPSLQAELYRNPNLLVRKFREKVAPHEFSEIIIYCNSLSFAADWHMLHPGRIYELTSYYRTILEEADRSKLAIVVAEENTRDNLRDLVLKESICDPGELHIFPRLPLINQLEQISREEQFILLKQTLEEYKDQGFYEILLGCTHLDHPEFNKIKDLKVYQPGLIMLEEFISDYQRSS